jgi:hypothetical protein
VGIMHQTPPLIHLIKKNTIFASQEKCKEKCSLHFSRTTCLTINHLQEIDNVSPRGSSWEDI